MANTYLITGGAGFIGSHIAARLLTDGHAVRVVDNMLTGKTEHIDHLKSLNGDFTFHQISITEPDALVAAFKGVDYAFHEAALPSVPRSVANPRETHEHCVTGTLNVLIAARDAGVKRVVYAASSSAYGDVEGDFKTEDMPPRPISPYGAAKLAGEYYCQVFNEVYDLETVALRYFNVFGPRQDPTSQYAAVIPLFVTAMLRGKSPTIFGDGQQSRDFTFIDNVVHGNILASQAPDAPGHVMNLATGGRVSLNELVDKINAQLGTSIEPIYADERPGDIKHSRAGIDLARDLLDFSPIVDLDTGLARTIEFYRQQV